LPISPRAILRAEGRFFEVDQVVGGGGAQIEQIGRRVLALAEMAAAHEIGVLGGDTETRCR
jgi:hypothetical protein